MTGGCKHRDTRGGFTLIEILFATAIAAFILAGVMTSYIFSVKGFRGLSDYNQMQADGRRALDWFGRDVRFGMGISSWSSNSVVVLTPATVNSTGVVTSTNVITHTIQNGAWYRLTGTGGSKQLATNVSSLAFNLYDQAGNATTQTNQAVSVQVTAFLIQNFLNSTQTVESFSAQYRMRNAP